MKRKGFTLIEIALAVTLLAIVFAIALPSFIRMMTIGNEASVVEAMRAVVQACESYRMQGLSPNRRAGGQGVPASIAALATANPPYLDGRFRTLRAGQSWRGYRLVYQPTNLRTATVGNLTYNWMDGFTLRANPAVRGMTGQRYFYTDQSGVVRFSFSGPAGPNDPLLEVK